MLLAAHDSRPAKPATSNVRHQQDSLAKAMWVWSLEGSCLGGLRWLPNADCRTGVRTQLCSSVSGPCNIIPGFLSAQCCVLGT